MVCIIPQHSMVDEMSVSTFYRALMKRFFDGEITREELLTSSERQLEFDFEQSKRRLLGPKGGENEGKDS